MMEGKSNASSEVLELKAEIEALKERLQQKTDEYFGIVQAAKKVLERDKEKTETITRLIEECRQKDADHERTKTLLSCRDSLLEDMENNILELSKRSEEAQATKNEEIASIKRKLANSNEKVKEKCDEIYALKEELAKIKTNLEKKDAELILLQQNGSIVSETSINDSRSVNLESEINRLKTKVVELENLNLNSRLKVDELEKCICELNYKLEQERVARENADELCSGFKLEIETYKKRNEELDLALTQAKSLKMSEKGNSMFSEFVDERLKLEKDLVKLKNQNDALSNRNLLLENENDNLRQELMCSFAKGSVDSLSGDFFELQKEIFSLRSEVQMLRNENPDCDEVNEDRRIALNRTAESNKFVFGVCSSLREEMKVMKKKLSEAQKDREVYFDRLADSERKRIAALKQQKVLEAEVMKLQMRLKKEEGKRCSLKLSKEDKEKLVEVIPNIDSQLDGNGVEKQDQGQGNSALSNSVVGETEVDDTNDVSVAGDFDENFSEKRVIAGCCDGNLPLEKRMRQVRFNDDVFVHSATNGSSVKPLRRRNFRKPKHEVLQADVNRNPECKQQ